MNIIIAGGSATGYFLASALSEDEENNVVLVDSNPLIIQKAQNDLDCAAIEGDATDMNTLKKAGVSDCDAFVACTDDDETNIISCFIAENFKVPRRAAITKFVNYKENHFNRAESGLAPTKLLNLSRLVAEELLRSWGAGSFVKEMSTFANGRVMMIGVKIEESSPLANLKLKELDRDLEFLVGCIVHNGEATIPNGESQIQVDDTIYVLFPVDRMNALDQYLHLSLDVGYGGLAVLAGEADIISPVAIGLSRKKFRVNLVGDNEKELEKLLAKAGDIPGIKVNRGGLDSPKIQNRLEVPKSDLFVSVFRDDTANILNCFIAKSLGSRKTIALINRQDLTDVAGRMGVDSLFSPRLSVLRSIKKQFKDMDYDFDFTTVADTPMEVLTLSAGSGSEIVGKPLKDISFPKQTLVGIIVNSRNDVILASGSSRIHAGDRAIVFCAPEMSEKLISLFKSDVPEKKKGQQPPKNKKERKLKKTNT